MKKSAVAAGLIGIAANFLLFLVKIYIGISSNSLSIYCDAVNNLGDAFACVIAFLGFLLGFRLGDRKSKRAQSLAAFVINLIIAATGIFFVYNGTERLFYPLLVTYSVKYAVVIMATIAVKILMGIMFIFFYKKSPSPILKSLVLDSFLDCFITLFALAGLFLIVKVNYAVDGIFAVICGSIITVLAIKNVVFQSKFLINN